MINSSPINISEGISSITSLIKHEDDFIFFKTPEPTVAIACPDFVTKSFLSLSVSNSELFPPTGSLVTRLSADMTIPLQLDIAITKDIVMHAPLLLLLCS